MHIRQTLVAATLMQAVCLAGATPLCRWVDSSGRTQVAAVVPEAYRKVATCLDSQTFELSAAQRQAAELRGAQERGRAREAADPLPGRAASSPQPPERAASMAARKRPVELITDDTDCPTRWRIYDESVDCFGPFRTTRGATKPEAFEHCNVVGSPEPRCGPRVTR